jgi:hypothetical protein
LDAAGGNYMQKYLLTTRIRVFVPIFIDIFVMCLNAHLLMKTFANCFFFKSLSNIFYFQDERDKGGFYGPLSNMGDMM